MAISSNIIRDIVSVTHHYTVNRYDLGWWLSNDHEESYIFEDAGNDLNALMRYWQKKETVRWERDFGRKLHLAWKRIDNNKWCLYIIDPPEKNQIQEYDYHMRISNPDLEIWER